MLRSRHPLDTHPDVSDIARMDTIEDVEIGQLVYVIAKREQGPVSEKNESSLIVSLLTGRVKVREGEFEKR